MRDRIEIRELKARGILGVGDHERKSPQEIVVSLSIFTDTRPAARTDSVSETIDYYTLGNRVRSFVEESSFFLVERLAEAVAALCIKEFGVRRITVTVEKTQAFRVAKSVGVTITREAADFGA